MISENRVEINSEVSFDDFTGQDRFDYITSEALRVLESTSRTFYIPISRLPAGLLEAVGSGYLCLRAIDEIEDHPSLDTADKIILLRDISIKLQAANGHLESDIFLVTQSPYCNCLPEVTLRIGEWISLAPLPIAPRLWDATASMADRMASWAANGWNIQTEADLESYTFGVAGAVGLMLSDIWAWYDGTRTDRLNAVGFGRGLQSVNILRNRGDDLARGVDFFPDGWDLRRMHTFSRRQLKFAEAYMHELPAGPVQDFCRIPLALAYATIDALEQGRTKLNREEVSRLVDQTIPQ